LDSSRMHTSENPAPPHTIKPVFLYWWLLPTFSFTILGTLGVGMSVLKRTRRGKNTTLSPTVIGERYRQTISNYVKLRFGADMNSLYNRKCWTNSVVPLVNPFLWDVRTRAAVLSPNSLSSAAEGRGATTPSPHVR
jgi:hypothetical protein